MTTLPNQRKIPRAKQYAQIEHISIMGATSRMGPIGLWVYAKSYLNAVQVMPTPDAPFEPVRYHLVCHSIELSLKAFLSLQGATMLELSDNSFGHNLQALLSAAKNKNIQGQIALSNEHHLEIEKASVYYAGKVFEYPAVGEALSGYPSIPLFDQIAEAAKLLVEALQKPCSEAQ